MLGSVVSFEACCQWALLNVQITRHYPTINIYCIEVQFYPSVSNVHAGFFHVSIIHRTVTGTTCAYVIILMHAYAHGGWGH